MTREEAITVLKAFMENPLFSDVHKNVFNIAIHDIKQRHDWDINKLMLVPKTEREQEPCEDATLKDIFCMGCEYKEQEPCEDAISRAYLLSIANMDGAYGYVSAHDIAKAPSVTPKQRIGHWIPVSERLPEVDEDGLSEWVLVTTKNIDKAATMYDRLCANSWLTECFDGEKVLAWQPLPEPYKAESED